MTEGATTVACVQRGRVVYHQEPAVGTRMRVKRGAWVAAVLLLLGVGRAPAAVFDAPSSTSTTNRILGMAPSGLLWEAVATGTALPIRSATTAANGSPGAVAYYNVDTGQLQIDPRGWDISLFNFVYTTDSTNVVPGGPGPLLYASGTSPLTAAVSLASGIAGQRTFPAGAWGGGMTASPTKVSSAVSLIAEPTLATTYDPGNGASNGTFPYSTNPIGRRCVPGWLNEPWSFPHAGDAATSGGLMNSGSIAAGVIDPANWKVFGKTGNANALGFGSYVHVFHYTINGVAGGQVGAIIPAYTGSSSVPYTLLHVGSGTMTQVGAGYPQLSGGRPFMKTGGGTLVVTAANTTVLPIDVAEGTLVLGHDAAVPRSRVSVDGGATLALAPGVAASISELTLGGGSRIDVANGSLHVARGVSTASLVSELQKGRGDGSWNGREGITSSSVAAEVELGIKRTLGWQSHSDGSVTVASTAPGDTNLDGLVDLLDAGQVLLAGKYDAGGAAIWSDGDFNYDGLVDILDVKDFLAADLYDRGFFHVAGSSPAVSVVPEPGTAGGMLLGVWGFGFMIAWRAAATAQARRSSAAARPRG